jgi:hypothetical protein
MTRMGPRHSGHARVLPVVAPITLAHGPHKHLIITIISADHMNE